MAPKITDKHIRRCPKKTKPCGKKVTVWRLFTSISLHFFVCVNRRPCVGRHSSGMRQHSDGRHAVVRSSTCRVRWVTGRATQASAGRDARHWGRRSTALSTRPRRRPCSGTAGCRHTTWSSRAVWAPPLGRALPGTAHAGSVPDWTHPGSTHSAHVHPPCATGPEAGTTPRHHWCLTYRRLQRACVGTGKCSRVWALRSWRRRHKRP